MLKQQYGVLENEHKLLKQKHQKLGNESSELLDGKNKEKQDLLKEQTKLNQDKEELKKDKEELRKRLEDLEKIYDQKKTSEERLKTTNEELIKIQENKEKEKDEIQIEKIRLEKERVELQHSLEVQQEKVKNFQKFGKNWKRRKKKDLYLEYEKKCYTCVIDFEGGIKEIGKGYSIYDHTKESYYKKDLKETPIIVTSLGYYGKGKTFIHGKITESDLPDGITLHTRGISMKKIDINGCTLWVLDSAGFQTPIRSPNSQSKDHISMKKIDEDFISNIVLNLSDVFIFVVQHLTLQEQELLDRLKEIISSRPSDGRCKIYVIHNFSDVWREDDSEKLWREEVLDIYEGEFNGNSTPPQFKENGKVPVVHLCVWNNDSEIGRKNNDVYNYLRNSIKTTVCPNNPKSFIVRVQDTIEKVLPNYIPFEALKLIEKEEKGTSLLIEESNNQDDINQNIVARIKPNPKITKIVELNRYLDSSTRTTMNSMNIQYDEITEEKIFTIILDTPGLSSEHKIPISLEKSIKTVEHQTKSEDSIKIAIFQTNDANIQIEYERIINRKKTKSVILQEQKGNGSRK